MEREATFSGIQQPVEISSGVFPQTFGNLSHYHDANELVYFEHADLRLFYHNRWCTIRDNTVLWIPEYQLHSFVYMEREKYCRTVINFKMPFLYEGLCALRLKDALDGNAMSELRILRLTPGQRRYVLPLFELCDEYCTAWKKTPTPTNAGLLKSTLITLLGCVLSMPDYCEQETAQIPQAHVHCLTTYIDAHFAENLSLDALAKMLHINKSYLCRMFREQMNMTVIRYIQYRRVVEAQKRLMFTDLPIDVVAAECGFNSLQRFYKVFHDISGYTPRDYQGKTSHG